jgi:hypothetical protein
MCKLIQSLLLFLQDIISGILLTFDFLTVPQYFLSSLLHFPVADLFLVSVFILFFEIVAFQFIWFLRQILISDT